MVQQCTFSIEYVYVNGDWMNSAICALVKSFFMKVVSAIFQRIGILHIVCNPDNAVLCLMSPCAVLLSDNKNTIPFSWGASTVKCNCNPVEKESVQEMFVFGFFLLYQVIIIKLILTPYLCLLHMHCFTASCPLFLTFTLFLSHRRYHSFRSHMRDQPLQGWLKDRANVMTMMNNCTFKAPFLLSSNSWINLIALSSMMEVNKMALFELKTSGISKCLLLYWMS